jgi:hypothetical protein
LGKTNVWRKRVPDADIGDKGLLLGRERREEWEFGKEFFEISYFMCVFVAHY